MSFKSDVDRNWTWSLDEQVWKPSSTRLSAQDLPVTLPGRRSFPNKKQAVWWLNLMIRYLTECKPSPGTPASEQDFNDKFNALYGKIQQEELGIQ